MPTALNTLRSRPAHTGHSVRDASENDWTTSKSWPHSVHAYWYVGTDVLLGLVPTLALVTSECQLCVIKRPSATVCTRVEPPGRDGLVLVSRPAHPPPSRGPRWRCTAWGGSP